MNEARMYDILRSPVVSEKTVGLSQSGKGFVFRVAIDSTKQEIKAAVEKLFEVEVKNVTTSVVKGKQKRFKGRLGQRVTWKKAYIRLAEGQTIDLGDQAAS